MKARHARLLQRRARGRPGTARVAALVVVAALALGGCLPSAIRTAPTPTPVPSQPTPPPAPTPTPGPPTPTPGPTFVLHTVARGDTLTRLARAYKTTARSIAYWNRDQYPSLDPESRSYKPDALKLGWVLRVMPGTEYSPPPDDGETDETTPPLASDDADGGDASDAPVDASGGPGGAPSDGPVDEASPVP